MGERRTLELALTGRLFSAPEARDYGLVHEICPAFELDDRAWHTARHLATLAPEALRRGLEFTRITRELSGDGARTIAAEMMDETRRSSDYAEGIRALRERRPPRWPSLESD
jgi:enoyl-CoA hydratase/carnithine racemase